MDLPRPFLPIGENQPLMAANLLVLRFRFRNPMSFRPFAFLRVHSPLTIARFAGSALLVAWVKLRVVLHQARALDRGVDLRRRNVRVAQHFLDRPQVRPAAEQVGGE